MRSRLRSEFEAAVVALAETYGASRDEVRAAARLVSSGKRRGPKRIDDGAVVFAVALTVAATGRRMHNVAAEEARKMVGVPPDMAVKTHRARRARADLNKTTARLSKKAKAELARAGWKDGEPEDVAGRIRDRRAQRAIRIRRPQGEV